MKTAPNFEGNYIASNIDIIDPRSGDRVPLAQRFKKFTTKNQGIRILAFGFLFDFTGNANNTIVQPVEETIKQDWFQQAIRDREVDLFLVAGHVPLRSDEFSAIHKAIRGVQWDAPIQFFGGHTHIRDYAKYDSRAYALESGRYLETIGFMSITGLNTGGKPHDLASASSERSTIQASPKFGRRYIDNNLFSFLHHTSLNETSFPTTHGRNVSATIASARKTLGLDFQFGCAPIDLWTNRAPYPSESSIFTWLEKQVLADMINDEKRGDTPALVILNTGAVRFDIFQGAFTVDTTWAVSPFIDNFRYIQDVPFNVAEKVLTVLNNGPNVMAGDFHTLQSKAPVSLDQQNSLETLTDPMLCRRLGAADQIVLEDKEPKLLPGYTTVDDGGSDGDDTRHSIIKFYRVPNCIASRIGFPSCARGENLTDILDKCEDPKTVDLVFLDFIQPYILTVLKFLGNDYEREDTKTYMEGVDITTLITKWVTENWKGEC